MILRYYVLCNTSLLVRAFVMYVRLEYNCITWSPCDIELLEQVQSRLTKRLRGLHHHLYDKRLKLLKLQKLESCRLQQDLIWCYKILFGYLNIDHNAFSVTCHCH